MEFVLYLLSVSQLLLQVIKYANISIVIITQPLSFARITQRRLKNIYIILAKMLLQVVIATPIIFKDSYVIKMEVHVLILLWVMIVLTIKISMPVIKLYIAFLMEQIVLINRVLIWIVRIIHIILTLKVIINIVR